MKMERIRMAIKKWGPIRNASEEAILFLKQGCCFKIEKDQYELWKTKSPKSIFAYLGIFNGELKFIVVDCESDKNPDDNPDYYFIQDYLKGLNITENNLFRSAIDGNISVQEALIRNMNWTAYMESWIRNKAETTEGIFRAFVIPFSSLSAQFEEEGYAESILFLGLGSNLQADLILWKNQIAFEGEKTELTAGKNTAPVENAVYPCPPYCSPTIE
jgi:hypothetical protein